MMPQSHKDDGLPWQVCLLVPLSVSVKCIVVPWGIVWAFAYAELLLIYLVVVRWLNVRAREGST